MKTFARKSRKSAATRHLSAAALALLAWAQPAGAAINHQFSSGAQGWSLASTNAYVPGQNPSVTTTAAVQYMTSGGDPGGYIAGPDLDNEETFFVAPSAFLGDKSAYLGGTLQYSRMVDHTPDWDGTDVVLQGGGLSLVFLGMNLAVSQSWGGMLITLAPGAGWVNRTYETTATLAEFQTVLANLTALHITAEYTAGVVETGGLDSVVMTEAPVSGVPEPESAALLAAGLGLLATRRRQAHS